MPFIVKNTTKFSLPDLIAPHSCRGCGRLGTVLCDCCKFNIIKNRHNFCPNCKRKNKTGKCSYCKSLPRIFVVDERDNLIGTLVHDYKYGSVRALSRPLAELLDKTLPIDLDKNSFIVPLPTISRHVRERGLDHTYKLAKELARLRGFKVSKLLIRNKNTVQVGADKKSRLSQASLAYEITNLRKVDKDATYILLDDVWTTGATIKAAVKKLRSVGIQNIIVLILAVSKLK